MQGRLIPTVPDGLDPSDIELFPENTVLCLYNGPLDGDSCAEEFEKASPSMEDKVVKLGIMHNPDEDILSDMLCLQVILSLLAARILSIIGAQIARVGPYSS